MPDKYAPIRSNGDGKQSVYLTTVTPALMHVLAGLIGEELQKLMSLNQVNDRDLWTPGSATGLQQWEEHITRELMENPAIPDTDRLAFVLARRGQGRFKERVQQRPPPGLSRGAHALAGEDGNPAR